MRWTWCDDPLPPEPRGVVGLGGVARRLLETVAQSAPPAGALMATANDDALVLTGAVSVLPWVDGVQYLAPRLEAPALWLPTAQRPTISLDLLVRAVARRHPGSSWLMLREPAHLIPLNRLLPLDAALMGQIRSRWAA